MIEKTLVFRAPKPFNKTVVWDISTKKRRDNAYLDLFDTLDCEFDLYKNEQDSVTCTLLPLARQGNPEAAEALLCYRRNKTGEEFEEIDVTYPNGPLVLRNDIPEVSIDVDLEEGIQTC